MEDHGQLTEAASMLHSVLDMLHGVTNQAVLAILHRARIAADDLEQIDSDLQASATI